jgi:hypothetical protein
MNEGNMVFTYCPNSEAQAKHEEDMEHEGNHVNNCIELCMLSTEIEDALGSVVGKDCYWISKII